MSLRLVATVDPAGRLVPEAPHVWVTSLRELAGKRVTVTVATEAQRRSTQANRFWWAVVVPTFQEIWSRGRIALDLPPYDKDETHEVLVQALAGYEDGPLPGTRVRTKTSRMTTAQFSKLVDGARQLAIQEYQIFIPEPGQPWEVTV